MYLINANYGWAAFKIESLELSFSYVYDSVNELLDAIEIYIDKGISTCVRFDAEGVNWKLIIDDYTIAVIFRERTPTLCFFDIQAEVFIEEILLEIIYNIDDWSSMIFCADDEDATVKQNLFERATTLYEKVTGNKI
jgi:hypothetical protein